MFDMLKHNQISAWNTRVVDCCNVAWIMVTYQKQYVNCSVDAENIAVASDIFLSYDRFANLWSYRIYVVHYLYYLYIILTNKTRA